MRCAVLGLSLAVGHLALSCAPSTLDVVITGVSEGGEELRPLGVRLTLTDRFALRVELH